ncbi:hypothetical protein ACG04R_28380 [Roseateles sp. BYS78W]|uniref:DUF1570 domain-containing protein n=1 Tax=Pelomonas candidula TaxID=3299025 RepID=A0ABW7HL18_9BURK
MLGRRWRRALVWGLLCWSGAASAASWMLAESPHFRVLAHTSRSNAEAKLQDLERLHEAMLMVLGATASPSRPPFPMVLSDDQDLIGRVRPHLRDRRFAGLFMSSADGAQAFAVNYRGAGEFTDRVLFHEYAHRLMFQYARMTYPVWFVEGFAEYFGATKVDPSGVEIGGFNESVSILGQRFMLDPERLLKPNFRSTGDKEADDSFFHLFYPQSWLLTHYVLSETPRVERFNEYFRRVAAGEDALAALEPATGIAPARLNGELRRHLSNQYTLRIPAGKAAAVRITELQDELAESLFDDMLITSLPEAAQGKEVLARQRERVKKAGGDRAPDAMRWALAHAEIRYGDTDKALELLAPWAGLDEAPFEANRLLGWAWQSEAARTQGAESDQALEQALGFLMAAYKQRRNDAPTLYQLARVLLHKGPSASLSNAAESASLLEPQVAEYAHLAVYVHLQAGHRDKALRPLQTLASNPHGGEGAERARAALQALQSNQDADTVLALLNGSKKADTP